MDLFERLHEKLFLHNTISQPNIVTSGGEEQGDFLTSNKAFEQAEILEEMLTGRTESFKVLESEEFIRGLQ